MGITDFWTYVLGAAAIILLPGPNSIFVLSLAARRGVRAGYQGAAGVFVGDTVLMTLSAAGVASLLRTYPPLFLVIKYAGAAYLFWVGLGIILDAWRKWRARAAAEPAAAPAAGDRAARGAGELRHPFRRAAGISLLNPKAILFFISFFIQFVEPGYAHPALSFLVLGAVIQVFSMLYLTALIFGGSSAANSWRVSSGDAGGWPRASPPGSAPCSWASASSWPPPASVDARRHSPWRSGEVIRDARAG